MNIFHLDYNPLNAAQWQHDKHVVKMTLETAQLLSQAVRLVPSWSDSFGDVSTLYRVTHQHHPSSRWARQSVGNLYWLAKHGIHLAEEYSYRFWRDHKSKSVIKAVLDAIPLFEGDVEITTFAQAMPQEYKNECPVLGYRTYYLAEKVNDNQKWTRRRTDLPDWLFGPALFPR